MGKGMSLEEFSKVYAEKQITTNNGNIWKGNKIHMW